MHKRFLFEKAVKPAEAARMGAAILRLHDEITLYDPSHYLDRVAELIADPASEELNDEVFDRRVRNIFRKPDGIVGHIQLGSASKQQDDKCGGAWRPRYVAARKGFGPLIYDVAMSHSPKGMIPDRVHISKFARPVWTYYFNRRDDVIKKPLKPRKPGAKSTDDGCKLYNEPEHPELDHVYVASSMPGQAKMDDNHVRMLSKLSRMYDRAGRSGPGFDMDNALSYWAASIFFNEYFPGK